MNASNPSSFTAFLGSGLDTWKQNFREMNYMAVTRRTFSAMLVSAVASPQLVFSQAKETQRIDVHHHIASPSWLQAIKLIGADDPVIANWSVQKSLDDMDEGGVAKQLPTSHPGRFSVFAP